MTAQERFRTDLQVAMASAGVGLATADRLCHACVKLLEVDGAAVSLVHDGASQGTFGSSGELSRRLDEFQFTFGEGPCLDAVAHCRPVLVSDLGHAAEDRWPAFAGALVNAGVRAVFALPIVIGSSCVGALDLFRRLPGPLSEDDLTAGLLAAGLASLPLLDLVTGDVDSSAAGDGGDGWEQLAAFERVDVYQATGMLIAQLDVDETEALARLRGYAFAHGQTASEVARAILERRLSLDPDMPRAVQAVRPRS